MKGNAFQILGRKWREWPQNPMNVSGYKSNMWVKNKDSFRQEIQRLHVSHTLRGGEKKNS